MRSSIVPFFLAGLFLLIAGGSYAVQHALDASSRRLDRKLDKIQQEIMTGDRAAARRSLKSLDRDWRRIEGGWTLITDHREMDQIDMSLIRLESLLRQNQIPLALAELSTMKRLVRHIPEKENFNLRNVL